MDDPWIYTESGGFEMNDGDFNMQADGLSALVGLIHLSGNLRAEKLFSALKADPGGDVPKN